MIPTADSSRLTRLLLTGAALIIVIAGLRAASELLTTFFMAALIAMLCVPVQNRLRKRGWSQGASVGLVAGLIILIGALLGLFVAVSTNQVIRKLPDYQAQFQQLEATTWTELDKLGLSEEVQNGLESFNIQSLFPFASSVLRGTVGVDTPFELVAPGQTMLRPGDTVALGLPALHLHCFDANGQRL